MAASLHGTEYLCSNTEMPGGEQTALQFVEMMGEGPAFDPAGLAAKYGVEDGVIEKVDSDSTYDADNGVSEFPKPKRELIQQGVRGPPMCRRPRVEGPAASRASGYTRDDANERATDVNKSSECFRADERGSNGMNPAVEELQNRNATLLEAVEIKSRQVQELGTMMEALEPVPGLDPDAFLSVLRGGGGETEARDCDYRHVKIVQLAKRSRSLSAKLEREKARCLKARREAGVLARDLEACRQQLDLVSSPGDRFAAEKDQRRVSTADLQPSTTGRASGNEERLRQQAVMLRNKLQEAQEEVKKSHRALAKEIGGPGLELDRALNDEGGWKGRGQLIIMLKARVKQLERQLSKGEGELGRYGGSRTRHDGRQDVDSQAREEIRFIERQRGHAMEHLEEDFDALHEEKEILRRQVVAKGARVAGLEKANVKLRDRVKMLLAKSDTDDRLVDALRCEIQALRKARDA